MGIFQKQYQRVLANEILRFLLLGKLPNITEISKRVSMALGKDGNVTFQYIGQPYKSVFNWKLYNKALRQIKFDTDLFYEEMLDLFNFSLNRVNYADLYHKVNSYELNLLGNTLRNLLFTVENADFYFLGAFESFADMSKTNREESTEGIVDLKEQVLSLPFGGRGVSRVKTNHLFNKTTWPVTITEGSKYITEANILPGTSFGNIFSDTISTWVYEVKTNKQNPVEIRIRFPLAGSQEEEIEVFINRIELITHSVNKQNVKIRVSSDNVNYASIVGYEQGSDLIDQAKVYGLDFETNLVQYIEITFRKESPDSEVTVNGQKYYQYLFGLKSFSAYTTGRVKRATYQSLPFSFGDDQDKISKISLSSKDIELPGTSIEYSVALYNEELLTNFIPIIPINKNNKGLGANQVVEFNTVGNYRNRITVQTSGDDEALVYGSPFQGKSFYRIGDSLSPKPIFGTASLYRGYNCWYRDISKAFQIKNVSDVFIPFSQSDIESLYDTKQEVASHEYLRVRRQVELTLSLPPYYNSARGHALKPDPSFQGTSINLKPNYAIYSVQQISTVERKTTVFTPTSRSILLSATNIDVTDIASSPILYDTSLLNQYKKGIDYILETEDIGGIRKSTGVLLIPDDSDLLDSTGAIKPIQYLSLEYTPDPDITHKVISVIGNKVILDNAITDYTDSIQIEYRFVPKLPNEIIKSSVRISVEPLTGSTRTFYTEGTDYIVDPRTGSIQRLSSGSIPEDGSVYAQYSYRNAEEGIETFQIWAYVSSSAGIRIPIDVSLTTKKNNLIASRDLGEGFFVNTTDGLIDLTNAVVTPLLKQGWTQFIVRSKNPDINTTYGTNLIDQVIQLRDQNKKKVFKTNGLYFKEITALIAPMKQKTLNHLKVNTLKSDYSSFSIDDITDPLNAYLVLNFLPNTTAELYRKGPTEESVTDGVPQDIAESFLITWQAKIESEDSSNKLVVRIILERSDEISDGGITPKVMSYNIRASI